jgi:hypothetical protein
VPTNSYELIVLGDATAGLACAALCARRGMRTLVLTDETQPDRYTLGPLKLPTALAVLPGRGAGAAARVVRELGLDHALKRKVRDARVTAQVVGPDARIDLIADAAGQAKELVRELPDHTERALTAWDQAAEVAKAGDALLTGDDAFPGVGFFERRDAVKQAARATEAAAAWWQPVAEAPLLAALTALPAALGGAALAPPPLAIARALELWRAGAPELRGDGTGLRELLREKLTAAGGELRAGVAAELVAGWTKLTAVKLDTGEELGAGQVVAALPVGALVPLFGKKPPKRLLELAAGATLAGWRYAINLVIDAAAVPEGMAPVVLGVVDPTAPLADTNAFAIHAAEPDDQGRVVLLVTALIPRGDSDEPPGLPALAAFRAQLLARVEEIVPFAQQHLIVMHSPYDGIAPVVPGGRGGYDPPRGGPTPLPPRWQGNLEGGGGLAGVPYATGTKHLTLASPQVLPALGLDGELAVGWHAARIACNIAGKKRDYLRDEVVST